jgi:hypothetical protein
MAFDTTTRNRLAKFVAEARRVLTEEFSEQLQSLYGISAAGGIAPLERLTHLDAEGLELAATLRQRIAYLTSSSPAAGDATKPAIDRLTREQAFTVLNRLAAIRMAEKRGLIVESVGQQYQSRGFKVFESVAGSAIGDTYDRYRCYLFCLFDELAIDLGSLFDRRSPQAVLFPREQPLLALLALLDDADLQDLWAEDETIGWIYQYYNDPAERKKMREESAAPRNSRELAVRNQFFTPRYVVEFLTDNTLGRIWYEMTQGATTLKEQCRYLVRRPTEIFLKPGESAPEQPTQDGLPQEDLLKQPVFIAHRPLKDPRSILMLDPACGSMHFGLYAFDLFEAIYDEAWEIAAGSDAAIKSGEAFAPFCTFAASFADKAAFQREVPRMIVEHNLHGIDIDPRAAQIAGLSLWLRAQRAWHAAGVKPVDRPRITRSNIVCAEPMPGNKVLLAEFVEQQFPEGERAAFGFLLETVFDRMTLAGEAGSLLKIEEEIRTAIAETKKLWEKEPAFNQRMLFGGGGDAPEVTQKKLDLSGITDEQFWERAEERIYDALRDYAEQAESGGFQRRLFAEDAARGFAFIDVCRKRYDAVVMNPPFGNPPDRVADLLPKDAANNIYPAFVLRGAQMAVGFIGAITDRTFVVQQSFWKFRDSLMSPSASLIALADLGWGVLDGADVQVAAYIIRKGVESSHLFANLASSGGPAADELKQVVADSRWTRLTKDVIGKLPNSAFAHTLPAAYLSHLGDQASLRELAALPRGLGSNDSSRTYKAWYEVPASMIGPGKRYSSLCNGGPCSPFFRDDAGVAEWLREDGKLLVEEGYSDTLRAYDQRNCEHYFSEGLSFPKQSSLFNVAALPQDAIPTREGKGIVLCRPEDLLWILGYLNSAYSRFFVEATNGLHKQSGPIGMTPIPVFSCNAKAGLARLALDAWREIAITYRFDEASRLFVRAAHSKANAPVQSFTSTEVFCRIDEIVFGEINASLEDRATLAASPQPGFVLFNSTIADDISHAFGCVFARWDIRYATGEKAAPELPDPFAPLPVCPPGQLQNAHGLPAGPEDVPGTYPIKDIPWDGILVDDPNHPFDIERRVREVMEIIWTGKEGSPTAEAIELEACEILGVTTLRDYFRKPANFFADHLKRYSKSRRQAPIYWPLSTKSGSYTLWIYYHRLNDQTLHKCLADFLDPKIKDVENELGKLAGKDSGRAADLRDFLNELKDLKDEIERVIKLPWKPNLNDGVLITASPLWKLFRLSKWQKDLKACWEELEKGDYDWAHLAYTIWPERVEKVCEKDRSIAIAHGLEHLCKIEPPKPKKPRGKKASS